MILFRLFHLYLVTNHTVTFLYESFLCPFWIFDYWVSPSRNPMLMLLSCPHNTSETVYVFWKNMIKTWMVFLTILWHVNFLKGLCLNENGKVRLFTKFCYTNRNVVIWHGALDDIRDKSRWRSIDTFSILTSTLETNNDNFKTSVLLLSFDLDLDRYLFFVDTSILSNYQNG